MADLKREPELNNNQQNEEEFGLFLNRASAEVQQWPAWRQALLGGLVASVIVSQTPNEPDSFLGPHPDPSACEKPGDYGF